MNVFETMLVQFNQVFGGFIHQGSSSLASLLINGLF